LSIAIPANFGYRFYAYHLDTFYTCDWFMEPDMTGDLVRLKADATRDPAVTGEARPA
jgi:hypothetical protein